MKSVNQKARIVASCQTTFDFLAVRVFQYLYQYLKQTVLKLTTRLSRTD